MLTALGGCIFCCERELWATPLARRCGELLLVGLQLACKHVPHLVTQGGIVHVAMLALEEKVEQVLPAAVRWNELHKVHHHCCIALIEHPRADDTRSCARPYPLGTSASGKRGQKGS